MIHRPLRRSRLFWSGALRVLLPAVVLATAGCRRPDPTPTRALTVFAAASLTDVLSTLAGRWEEGGGGPVRLSFDATSRLAPQIVEGAPADLFFSADEAWMTWLEEHDAVRTERVRPLAGNDMVLVVPSQGPVPAGWGDLPPEGRVALAGENVPAGRYGRRALEVAGVWRRVAPRVVRAGSVRGALEWVAQGQVAAGVVYRSDAAVDPRVEVAFDLPGPEARYFAAPVEGSDAAAEAERFLAFVLGPGGRDALGAAGFTPVDPAVAAVAAGAPDLPPTLHLPDPAAAVRLSLWVALLATVAGLAPAVALGWLLARRDFAGKTLVSGAVLMPLVVPPVVTGFVLLAAFGREAPLGRALGAVGVQIPFSLLGAAVAAFVVGMPLYVLSVRGAFEAVDRRYEELSWTLGSPPRRTFGRISLPLAVPGIAAGALLAFARALGEFGATVVLAGNVEGETRTIALAVYTLLEAPAGRGAIWALVAASVAISLAALVGYEALSRRQRWRLDAR